MTEKNARGKATAWTKGTRGFLPRLGGIPWSRRKAEWKKNRDAEASTRHRKRKCSQRGQSEAGCSFERESCFWASMTSARSCRSPGCRGTRLCKANPRHTHVSWLVEAFNSSYTEGNCFYVSQTDTCVSLSTQQVISTKHHSQDYSLPLPAHGGHISLLGVGGGGGALADPAAVRQHRSLLLHLVQDLLPLRLRLRPRLLTLPLEQQPAARHRYQRGEKTKLRTMLGGNEKSA